MGDRVRKADGSTGTVWLKWEVHKTQEMYNLTVDTAHTFYVGEGQWLVHNACPKKAPKTPNVDDLIKAAKEKYPRLADKADQLHHEFPKYLGGDPKGKTVPLNPAYHQVITNAFRDLWGYGKGKPGLRRAKEIMEEVYKKFPLP